MGKGPVRRGSHSRDESRFEFIYASCFDRVAAYVLARTDRDSAADAVARTFEIAWRRIDELGHEPLPWLLGVARRVLADQRRALGRRQALVERIAFNAGESEVWEDSATAAPGWDELASAVRALPVRQREALLLIAWDGLSQAEAAQVLGCSRGSVAVALHRARRRIRAVLDGGSPVSRSVLPKPRNAEDSREVTSREAL